MRTKYFFGPIILGLTLATGCNSRHNSHTENAAAITDVVKETSIDEFLPINDTVFHRSVEKFHDEYNGDYYYYSEQNVSIEWPVQLSGCKDIKSLQKTLIQKAFHDDSYMSDIEATVHKFVNTPSFLEFEPELSAVTIKENESEGGMNNYYESISIHPFITSSSLLTFSILTSDYAGGAHGNYALTHVIFDKKRSLVFDQENTFYMNRKQEILDLLNDYIDRREKGYEHTTEIPDFYADEKGFTFVFQPYEIACYAEGIVKIDIPHSAISDMITSDFKDAISNAGTFIYIEDEQV